MILSVVTKIVIKVKQKIVTKVTEILTKIIIQGIETVTIQKFMGNRK